MEIQYLLKSRDRMAMMKAMHPTVEFSDKISPLLHPHFYNIDTFNTSFKSQFNFTHNLDCNCFGCVVVYLKYVKLDGQSCPQSP